MFLNLVGRIRRGSEIGGAAQRLKARKTNWFWQVREVERGVRVSEGKERRVDANRGR